MQVKHIAEKFRYGSEAGVRLNLLQVGLRQTSTILPVVVPWSIQQGPFLPKFPDPLVRDQDFLGPLSLGLEAEFIAPLRFRIILVIGQMNLDAHFRIPTGMEATKLGNAATIGDSLLQATTLSLADVPQKSEHIQKV